MGYIQGVGFVAIINSQKGDYSNLAIAYMLARDIALNAKEVEIDKNIFNNDGSHIIKEQLTSFDYYKITRSNNIENNKTILMQLEKSILLMEFNQEYLKRFLTQGTLTKKIFWTFIQVKM
ncbi:MAG: hypothetical protein R3A12_07790 [Ignavibacteria bacterium]